MAWYDRHSTYSTSIINGVICIIDLNGPTSVINDAEQVIKALYAASGGHMPEPVIYLHGMLPFTPFWDGLDHADGVFTDYYQLDERDMDRAIAKAKERTEGKQP